VAAEQHHRFHLAAVVTDVDGPIRLHLASIVLPGLLVASYFDLKKSRRF